MEHWLPYDDSRLTRVLGTGRGGLVAQVQDNEHTLAQLALKRGKDPVRLAGYLVRPWRGHVSAARYRTLRRRASETLTQSHLANHLLGHPFHVRSLQLHTLPIFGVNNHELGMLRAQGQSFYDIGVANGHSRSEIDRAVMATLRKTARRGIRGRQTPRAWERHWLALQRQRLSTYLSMKPGPGSREHDRHGGAMGAAHSGARDPSGTAHGSSQQASGAPTSSRLSTGTASDSFLSGLSVGAAVVVLLGLAALLGFRAGVRRRHLQP